MKLIVNLNEQIADVVVQRSGCKVLFSEIAREQKLSQQLDDFNDRISARKSDCIQWNYMRLLLIAGADRRDKAAELLVKIFTHLFIPNSHARTNREANPIPAILPVTSLHFNSS